MGELEEITLIRSMVLLAIAALAIWCCVPESARAAGLDAFEPDNTVAQASDILPGEEQARTLYPAGDVDYAVFEAETAGWAIVTARTEAVPPRIQLYGSSQQYLTEAIGAPGSGATEAVLYVQPDKYIIRVDAPDGAENPGYVLRVLLEPGEIEDAEYFLEAIWPYRMQRQEFREIGAINTAPDNSLYVTDVAANAVHKMTIEGQFLQQVQPLPGSANAFEGSQGVAVADDGRIYVADTANNRVQVFGPRGDYDSTLSSLIKQVLNLSAPRGLVLAPGVSNEPSLFVADSGNNRVVRFGLLGLAASVLSGQSNPSDLALRNEGGSPRVYALRPGASSGRISVFDPTLAVLNVLRSFGTSGTGEQDLGGSSGLAIDRQGRTYVGDQNARPPFYQTEARIVRFDANENFDISFGSVGNARGSFNPPLSLAGDQRDFLYVADKDLGVVQKFHVRDEPDFLSRWGRPGADLGYFVGPADIAMDASGAIYVADRGNDRVQRIAPDGAITAWGERGSAPGQFNEPYGVTVDDDGRVWVTDNWNHRVQAFDANGTPLGGFGQLGTQPGFLNRPTGIAAGYTEGGILLLFVASTLNHRVDVFTEHGELAYNFGGLGTEFGRFTQPAGVAIGPDRTVYVVDRGNDRVQRFTFEGEFIGAWGVPGTGPGAFVTPEGIHVSPEGLVYIADVGNDRIQLFGPAGAFVRVIGGSGSGPGQFHRPASMTVDTEGVLYVSERGNHRVQRLAPEAAKNAEAPVRKALLIAGGGGPANHFGVPNPLWDAANLNVNIAYRALRHQGYAESDIRVLTGNEPYDIDGSGNFDTVMRASQNSLIAAQSWAADADSLLVYIIGPNEGGEGVSLDGSARLTVENIASWTDPLSAENILVIIDCPGAGDYAALSALPRVTLIASCEAQSHAYYFTRGTISFSYYFWTSFFSGASVQQAFDRAHGALTRLGYQTPFIAGADKQPTVSEAYGRQVAFDEEPPRIGGIADFQLLGDGDFDIELRAREVEDDRDRVTKVWAIMSKPSFTPAPYEAITQAPHIDLFRDTSNAKDEEDEEFGGVFDDADEEGVYQIDYFALDENGNPSEGEPGFAAKSLDPPGLMAFTLRREGTTIPVTDAQICVNPPLMPCVSAQVDGIYTLTVLVTSNFTVTITAPGYESVQKNMLLQAGTNSSDLVFMTPLDGAGPHHSADYNPPDFQINISELLRVVQFFNLGGYQCDPEGEDGYRPGDGAKDCTPHDSDYNPQNWRISINELLRLIQFFNIGSYHPNPAGEDGFEPGPASKYAEPVKQESAAMLATRDIENDGVAEQGEQLEVTIRMEYPSDATPVSALGFVEQLPSGWRFDGFASTAPPIVNFDEASGELSVAWIQVPPFPLVIRYRVEAESQGLDPLRITGNVIFRAGGGGEQQVPIQFCVAPAAPGNVAATSNLSDRVDVSWDAVAGATEYRVFRAAANNPETAVPISGWIDALTFSDTGAPPPNVPSASGCGAPPPPEPVPRFYWVRARSGPDCEGSLGGGVQGARSAAKSTAASVSVVLLSLAALGLASRRRRSA